MIAGTNRHATLPHAFAPKCRICRCHTRELVATSCCDWRQSWGSLNVEVVDVRRRRVQTDPTVLTDVETIAQVKINTLRLLRGGVEVAGETAIPGIGPQTLEDTRCADEDVCRILRIAVYADVVCQREGYRWLANLVGVIDPINVNPGT